MRKKWLQTTMLVLAFSISATGCSTGAVGDVYENVKNSVTGFVNNALDKLGMRDDTDPDAGVSGDTYVDYDGEKPSGNDAFDYDGNYAAPELTIDGKGDDAQWKAITTPLATFGNGDATTVKAYRGEDAIFFLFEVQDKILLTEGETNDDAVTRSDSVEFYLDTLADGGLKPQSDDYQINLGIHGKTRIMQGSGSGWGNWNGLIDYEVSLNGILNDGVEATDMGYSIEVMIPYTQINIEKEDTIAISFGQVDKVGAGNAATTDWDWYPWIYNGVNVEPQTPDNYILWDKDGVLMARDEERKPNVEMAGYVLDSATETAIADATVSTEIGGVLKTTTTDDSGFFSFADINPDNTYTLTVSKEGYISNTATYTRAELRAANGGRVQKNITIINETTVARTKLTGTVKNLINGAVGGATVSIEGTVFSATSDENGGFQIESVPVEDEKDITIIVSKEGYGESKTLIEYESLITEGDAVTALGDVNLNLPYAQTGGFGNKSTDFADSSMTLSRTLTGIEFNLTGKHQLIGHIEVYLDTKDCADHRDNDTTFWRFDLNDNGVISGSHFAGGAFSAEGLEYTLYKNEASGYSARFFVPFNYLDITPFEVFGISLGQWSTSADDWDGWGFAGQFVAPETPKTLIRLSATNELYRADSNISQVNLSGNIGAQGVLISIEGTEFKTTSGADGSWNMKVPETSEVMSIVYSCQGYVTKTTQIEAGYFNTHYGYSETVELSEQRVSVSGTVTDSETGIPMKDVTVTVAGTNISATTDENGKYTLELGTFVDVTLKFTLADYTASDVVKTAIELAASAEHTVDVTMLSTNQIQYITVFGTVTNVNGPVVGATVTVDGNSVLTATTDAQGHFEIENFASIDGKLIVTKTGYITTEIKFTASDVESDATEFDVGEKDMPLEYKALQGLIADKSDSFAAFKGYVTRSAVGFEFKFIGSRAFVGNLELFVDTKESSAVDARNTTDYMFALSSDGNVAITNWGNGSNTVKPDTMKYSVINAGTLPELNFTLPYTFLGVEKTEVVGISAGQWHTGISDWDGWDNFNLIGINNEEFVKPEWTQDYIRIGAHNELYAAASNDVVVDFTSYQVNFGTGVFTENPAGALGDGGKDADNFYAKVVSRDENGITFEFITTANFGTNSGSNEKEMILIYFDTGADSAAGWGCDYLLKIASDGTVYGSNGAWWLASDSNKMSTGATITKEGGVTKIVYTISYETLVISETDVFGFAMREASHRPNTNDHMLYGPSYDCYFEGSTVADTANCTDFIRVAADGTLYRDNNNNAND